MPEETDSQNLARAVVRAAEAYVPGEQPRDAGWIKLNTNENPYPPSQKVVEALQAEISDAAERLRLYPDPRATRFRETAAKLFGVTPEWILPGNGSDEILAILLRTFVESGEMIAAPYPSYTLYQTLADVHGIGYRRVMLDENWHFPSDVEQQLADAKLMFCPNPNSPSATLWDADTLSRLVPPRGLLVLDEAYGEFRDAPHRGELLQSELGERIVITRTFSKSHALAGIRLGYAAAHPAVISEMDKVRDSYNCDRLALAAGVAALGDSDWLNDNRSWILATRSRLSERLVSLGFEIAPSQANFVWCTHPSIAHEIIFQQLKDRKVLVRWMKFPDAALPLRDGLRITVGSDSEIDTFLDILSEIIS